MRLQHLKYVSIIPCSLLPANLALDYAYGQNLILQSIQPLMLNTLPDGDVSIEITEKDSHQEKLKATFYAERRLKKNVPLAFVLGFIDGSSYLVGTKENAVEYKQSDAMPKQGNKCCVSIELNYTAPLAWIPITVNTYTPDILDPRVQNTQWWREITTGEIDTIINSLS